MTTSQASRVFGIPYNSLLMYVRGKYGKSLKLDTLRKETLEGEAMALAASTRGSYKLAALSAAAAAASSSSGGAALPPTPAKKSSKNNSSNTANAAPSPGPPTPPISAKMVANNNNNETINNNNNNEVKAAQKGATLITQKSPHLLAPGHLNLPHLKGAFPPPLKEMNALSMAQSLAVAGLGGFGAVNPYLSYFCDFSFPMPLSLGGLLPHTPSAANAKLMRPGEGLLKKATDLRVVEEARKPKKPAKSPTNHSDVEMDSKDGGSDADEKVERAKSSLPHLLSRPLMQTSLDLSQTGQA